MNIKRINEFPEGSGSLSSDDVFLFMDDPSSGGVTKKISLSQLSNFIGANSINGLVSDVTGIPGAVAVSNIVVISQADYDNLTSVNSNTLYIIN